MTDTGTGTRLLALVVGFWILMRSINKDSTHRTLINHLIDPSGSGTQSPILSAAITAGAAGSSPGLATSGLVHGAGTLTPTPAGTVNPFPAAAGSRLDQGFDLTARAFLAPFDGVVLKAVRSDPGWGGGGYLAIQNSADPSQVIYMAEGIAPIVQAGQSVSAGDPVAQAAVNPSNGIVGNIEAGWASALSPGQPLAQTIANKPSAATSFYNWLRSLGGPAATSTAGAGYP
jgi:hypothetical protein